MKMNKKLFFERLMPILLAFALLLSISTNLRLDAFPIGPGELLLAAIAMVGVVVGNFWQQCKTPLFLFWLIVLLAMAAGSMVGVLKGNSAEHHAMAYIFSAAISVGLFMLIEKLNDSVLRFVIFWLCLFTAVFYGLVFCLFVRRCCCS